MFVNLGNVELIINLQSICLKENIKVCIHFWMTFSKINRNMEISIMSNNDIDPN